VYLKKIWRSLKKNKQAARHKILIIFAYNKNIPEK